MLPVAELPECIRIAEKLLSTAERSDVLNYLAAHPKAGDLVQGTGGVRKLRWAEARKASLAACGSSTIFTARLCRYIC